MRDFQTGKIAKGSSFLGREKIIKEVQTYIGLNQSVVLIAPRRFGKSSIIKKVIDNNVHNFKIITVDIMEIHSKRIFAEHIISEVYGVLGLYGILGKLKDASLSFFTDLVNHLASLKLSIGDIAIETTGKLLKETDEDKLLAHALALPNIVAGKLNTKFLFVIDEFGEIDKLQSKNELTDTMRSIFQKQENVVFLFAGSQYALMTKIFIEKSSAFHKFAVHIEVPTMKGEDFAKSFKDIFYSKEISLPSNFAKEVEKISQGIPYYIVRIAQEVLINALLKDKMNIHCFSIRLAALVIFKKEQSYFTSELNKFRGKKYDVIALRALSENKNHTEVLAELGVSRQNANAIINSLVMTGIVEKRGKEYIIVDPFMRRYIKKL